ncbi:MAG: hypothetical protein HQ551_02820 [Desulfobacteraceae bacterium]|nr:hypothetical protein [Desulfobacteraceae bacterium]
MRFESADEQNRWVALGVTLAAALFFFMCQPEKAWGRDPFELPPGVQLSAAREEVLQEAVKPPVNKKVTAILITDSRKVAAINHKVVVVGDFMDGEKVLEIKPDQVILEKSGQKYVIMLEKNPVKWTKNKGKEDEK